MTIGTEGSYGLLPTILTDVDGEGKKLKNIKNKRNLLSFSEIVKWAGVEGQRTREDPLVNLHNPY